MYTKFPRLSLSNAIEAMPITSGSLRKVPTLYQSVATLSEGPDCRTQDSIDFYQKKVFLGDIPFIQV